MNYWPSNNELRDQIVDSVVTVWELVKHSSAWWVRATAWDVEWICTHKYTSTKWIIVISGHAEITAPWSAWDDLYQSTTTPYNIASTWTIKIGVKYISSWPSYADWIIFSVCCGSAVATTAPVMWWAGTTTVSAITDNWATLWGTYTDWGSPITANWFVVYPSGNASTVIWWANVIQIVDTTLSSPLSETPITLVASTNYCFKPYATNAIGTSYGTELCFTTSAAPFIYTGNLGGNSVSKINTSTNTVVATAAWTNSQPHSAIRVWNNIYIWNHWWQSIQRIDTATMTITGTISTLPDLGKYMASDGTLLYVCSWNSLRKIDIWTFTVIWTATGLSTWYQVKLNWAIAYVTSNTGNRVDKINTATMTVVGTIAVWVWPIWIAIYNWFAFVCNQNSNSVSKIDLSTDTVVATIMVGINPYGIGQSQWFIYVTNFWGNSISKINPATNAVVATIAVTGWPLAFESVWDRWYIACSNSSECKVLNTVTDTIIATIPVWASPYGIAV